MMGDIQEDRQYVQAEIPVYGMTCEHCVRRVTKALENLPGVDKVQVSLADSKAVFPYDTAKIKLDDINRAIEDEGIQRNL